MSLSPFQNHYYNNDLDKIVTFEPLNTTYTTITHGTEYRFPLSKLPKIIFLFMNYYGICYTFTFITNTTMTSEQNTISIKCNIESTNVLIVNSTHDIVFIGAYGLV